MSWSGHSALTQNFMHCVQSVASPTLLHPAKNCHQVWNLLSSRQWCTFSVDWCNSLPVLRSLICMVYIAVYIQIKFPRAGCLCTAKLTVQASLTRMKFQSMPSTPGNKGLLGLSAVLPGGSWLPAVGRDPSKPPLDCLSRGRGYRRWKCCSLRPINTSSAVLTWVWVPWTCLLLSKAMCSFAVCCWGFSFSKQPGIQTIGVCLLRSEARD